MAFASRRPSRAAGRARPGGKPGAFGFTLLEVLVTVVVLALGLLGLAGLQVFSLKNNHVSYYHAIASQQAYDMEDRIRANLGPGPNIADPCGTSTGIVTGGSQGCSYDKLIAPPADPGCANTASGCTPAQMAQTDYRQWLMVNAALLPNGSGSVICQSGPPLTPCVNQIFYGARVFNIIVTWLEKDSSDANPAAPFVDPNCPAGTAANVRCFVTTFSP